MTSLNMQVSHLGMFGISIESESSLFHVDPHGAWTKDSKANDLMAGCVAAWVNQYIYIHTYILYIYTHTYCIRLYIYIYIYVLTVITLTKINTGTK